jgi:hypothetical protein
MARPGITRTGDGLRKYQYRPGKSRPLKIVQKGTVWQQQNHGLPVQGKKQTAIGNG